MNYMLTEMYSYTLPASFETLGYVGHATICPGEIDGEYAKMIFGDEFDRAVQLGVLVPING